MARLVNWRRIVLRSCRSQRYHRLPAVHDRACHLLDTPPPSAYFV